MSVDSKFDVLIQVPVAKVAGSVPNLTPQAELFPLRCLIEYPQTVDGADVWGVVVADDNHRYFVKESKGGDNVRAAEWVGTHIAQALDIPCAEPRVIQIHTGKLLFGSRELRAPAAQTETAAILTTNTIQAGRTAIPGLKEALSRNYVLDMFLNNIDRHENNFILAGEGHTRKLYSIDFARCLFWHPSFDAFPAPNHQTIQRGRVFRAQHGFDIDAARRMLDQILKLAPEDIIAIMSRMPRDWLSQEYQNQFVNW